MANVVTLNDRETSPLAVLMDPRKGIPVSERDIRVEDWLNDKIQVGADLDINSLDALLESVEAQKNLLEDQLRITQIQLHDFQQSAETKKESIVTMKEQFQDQKDIVDAHLLEVTSSATPEEALLRLKGPLEKLRKLELAGYYVDLLSEVEVLMKDACGHLPANPKEALKPYAQLKRLAQELQKLQEPAEGAATHLVAYVQDASSRLWADMKRILSSEFDARLRESNWPNNPDPPTREWSDSFEKMLDLQGPEIISTREPLILLPMSLLAKPFIQQCRYHFFSNMPTNHPNKLGEFFFPWFIGTVDRWQDFLRENLTPILAAHFRGTPYAGNSLYIDPVAAFITALLPIVQEKVDSIAVHISNDPLLLSRFTIELLKFDSEIRDKYDYDAGNTEFGWKGLAWNFLGTWFDRWLEIEKDFAMKRYQEIVKERNSPIDYDSAGPGKTKPTFEATKVTELLSAVTEQYCQLRKFSYKTKFLISIQAEILDQYLERLKSALDFYENANTTVGRTLHGVTKEELAKLEGIGGLETLCRVFGSADHFMLKLRDWSNERFFIDLWDQMQGRAKDTSAEDKLAGDMTYTEIKEITSDALGTEDEGSVFDVTIDQFQRQKDRAERLIISALKYSFPLTFKQYITKPQWATIEEPASNNLPPTITAELDQPLQVLKRYMEFLRRALSEVVFRRICRAAVGSLQNTLFKDVLLTQSFTQLGAARFKFDVSILQDVIDSVMAPATAPLTRLTEGAILLNLPVADGGSEPLKEACKDILHGTEEAAERRLEIVGASNLTEVEARAVLKSRVENTYDFDDGGDW